MSRFMAVMLSVAALVACVSLAADGVWSNASSGTWSDTTKWTGGVVAGNGGAAVFNAASGTLNVTNDQASAVSLSSLSANTNAGNAAAWSIIGGTNVLVAPALIYTRADSLSVRFSTLAGSGDITITGLGKFYLGDDNLYAGRTIISNGNVRVARDSGFGPVPVSLQADAIILDNGGLENDDNAFVLTNAATRGITVTANGGFLGCGYTSAGFLLNGPITGPGLLGINFENCYVMLNNPSNDYSGGTFVGTNGPGANVSCAPTLKLGQGEVIPDGVGKLGLWLGADSLSNSTLPVATLDLNGKTETVNTLVCGPRAQITSSVANQGCLIVGGLGGDNVVRGVFSGGATLQKQGAGALALGEATLSSGTFDLRGGTTAACASNFTSSTTVILNGGALQLGGSALSANALAARILLSQNSSLTISDAAASTFSVAGGVATNVVVTPEPVLTIANGGLPLVFGSSGAYPAALDASVSCAGGIVFTNKVWLRRLPTSAYSIAYGASVALDGTTLLGGTALNITNYSVRVVRTDSVGGDGSVTVNTNAAVWFDTMRYAGNALTNDSTVSACYSNAVVLKTGTAGFDGVGTITYGGAITGSGTVVKNGSGDLLLTGTGSSISGEIQINSGRLLPASEAALGGATVRVNGGRLVNPAGSSLTLSSTPIIAQLGGFEATAAGEVLTLNGLVTGSGPVSKWGNGTLSIGGTAMNTNFQLYARSGTVELNKSGATNAYAVLDLLGIQSNTLVRLTGSNGNQIGGTVVLDGGTFDLKGLSETIGVLTNTTAGGVVTNGGAMAATLTVGDGDVTSTFSGRITDGAFSLKLAKTGQGAFTVPLASLASSGGLRVDGGTLRVTPWTLPTTGLVYRLDASDTSKLTLSGSSVTAWADSFTSGVSFAQSTASMQPTFVTNCINGLPAIRFGTTGRTRMAANKAATARTLFIVSRVTGYPSAGLSGIWGQDGNDAGLRQCDSTSWRFTGNSGDGNDFAYNGQMFINGTAGFSFAGKPLHLLSAVSPSDKLWTAAIGDYWNSSTMLRYFIGDIGEILVYNTVLSTNDRQVVESYLRSKWLTGSFLPSNQTVTVASGGRLVATNMTLTVATLAGTGGLGLEGGSTARVVDYSSFTGSVFGVGGTVCMQSASGTNGRFQPQDLAVLVRNDGTQPVSLRVEGSATNSFFGMVADGSNTLGITQAGSGVTLFAGTNSTYTGATRIEAGTASVQNGCIAQYIRFWPTFMRYGGSNYATNSYQISEFQLMQGGGQMPYPSGTTAYAPLGNSIGNSSETPLQTIDNNVNTKFFTNLADANGANPLIVKLPAPAFFDGYRWYTANDSTGRDPIRWNVAISLDGANWTTVDAQDYQTNMTAITSSRQVLAGVWSLGAASLTNMNVFSDASATTVASPGVLALSGVRETVGPLSSNGAVRLSAATLGINAFTNAAFSGGITGSGTVVKAGSATESLSGALAFSGDIIVSAGTLDLNGAVLTGVTNVTLQSGARLIGSATVNGNLTVTFAGGTFSGALAVSGALSVTGIVRLDTPDNAAYPYSRAVFSYASANDSTLAALAAAVKPTAIPKGYVATVRVSSTTTRLFISPGGMIIKIL